MEDKKAKRDYNREYQNEKGKIKRYTIRVPLYQAKALDEKLKKEGKKYSEMMLQAIDKYIKKS